MMCVQKPIFLKRFYLRHLTHHDATSEYLSWFDDEVTKNYIDFAAVQRCKIDLVEYIDSKNACDSVLFFGIFSLAGGEHIGNIKFEPVDFARKTAEMGILIGSKDWRGKRVAPEVILGMGSWLNEEFDLQRMTLGVAADNIAAIKAYKKIGFVSESVDQSQSGRLSYRMSLSLFPLIKA